MHLIILSSHTPSQEDLVIPTTPPPYLVYKSTHFTLDSLSSRSIQAHYRVREVLYHTRWYNWKWSAIGPDFIYDSTNKVTFSSQIPWLEPPPFDSLRLHDVKKSLVIPPLPKAQSSLAYMAVYHTIHYGAWHFMFKHRRFTKPQAMPIVDFKLRSLDAW